MGFWESVAKGAGDVWDGTKELTKDVDWGNVAKGAGALAGAWGAYETGKEQNKILRENLAYEKSKDAITANKQSLAQNELNNALVDVYGKDEEDKKKKKKSADKLTDAFVAPA